MCIEKWQFAGLAKFQIPSIPYTCTKFLTINKNWVPFIPIFEEIINIIYYVN